MISGILNVLKPTGMTSHDIIGQVRRLYHMKKVGHAGTLDPLAAGVLPVYLGQATRLIEYGDNDTKTYHAEFILGIETDTEDITGTVVAVKAVPPLTAADIQQALQTFLGDTEQLPSRYAAININGVKAYKLARHNQDFTLPTRTIHVDAIRLYSYENGRGVIGITCSKGTYVRSLLRDLGKVLGTCATMSYLVRVTAGLFDICDAATLEELQANPMGYVQPMDLAIQSMEKACVSAERGAFLMQGRPAPFAGHGLLHGTTVRVYDDTKRLIGIAHFDKEHHVLRPHKMLPKQ